LKLAVYEMLYKTLKSLKGGTNDESNGRHIIPAVAAAATDSHRPRILDVGAGYGADLSAIAKRLTALGRLPELFAIESFPASIAHLENMGISVRQVDIEHNSLPFPDDYFDVVVCNQVLEHTKEIFWVVSEIARVTKRDGKIIVGVPNLGSLHNRIALLVGHQPPAIHVLGTHVRGFTVPGLTEFLETGGVLKVTRVFGGNFYPFPPRVSRILSKFLPRFSVSSFYLIEHGPVKGGFLDILDTPIGARLVDTPYFRGATKPAS